ncbi:MAG TPA: 2'-5' RNA ligase family protein [Puia sp.]|nr:2'-5' RNA ligase family protein [Puia sp.]
MADTALYFIAILPPKPIAERVIAIKQEFADRFQSEYALKPPPHVTLQAPFILLKEDAENLKKALLLFFNRFSPFEIRFSGFGSFANRSNPVIFIQPLENEIMAVIHKSLMLFLRKIGFDEESTRLKFNPHMTVAYHDLTHENFQKAWPEFQERGFEADFAVEKIYLMKHDGKRWNPEAGFELSARSF